ncbi:hypothetical protein CYMTET_17512 [Cymbomonas tetramitiformis]|uniref:CCHC-type domain-containing protein n=1 Tax=Cymbomonas tetramitiformis TaxID=36881 RepID=A0AAE0L776_9CHLO|nr:hypothetical protein CYMTET_17512 [Cymbomonas tetramitiformis]
MPSLPGADAEWVRSTDSASRSARIRFADAKAHFASYFAVSKMVNAAVDHLAEGEVDACLEVLQLVDNESTLGTTRSIEMARTLAISQTHEFGFQRRNLERGNVAKKRTRTRNAAAEPAAELDGAAAPPMVPWVPDEARTCYRCHQVGHIGRNCPTVLNAAAVGAVPRRAG